ncbi:hypothetical protein R1sor_011646 [Riccia sorocarpa]|uniref:Uncharacterized protein n=1 Tax=Riccia sorocarpa TaxID=122646 RepID=A0ABD3I544_9MARC
MADGKEKSMEKGTKTDKRPRLEKPPQSSKAPQGDGKIAKGETKADPKASLKGGGPAATAQVLHAAEKGDPGKLDSKAQQVDAKTQKMEASARKESKNLKGILKKDEKDTNAQALRSDESVEVRNSTPEEGSTAHMLDAQGKVMLDEEGNPYPQLKMWDIEGNVIKTKKGVPIPGRFQFNTEGNIFLDAEGYPFLERQETTDEKKNRLEREARRKKLKTLREKLEAEREMMETPLRDKAVKWQKYSNTMYVPRSLKTAILRDPGRPGDDWRYFVKKYSIKEMNHRLTYQLHGKAGILWRKLHNHITYLQNPRHASENPKHFKALRIFRLEDTPKGTDWVLLDPPVAYFDGFEPGKTYVQNLRIFNLSPWSQRLRVIKPDTLQYSISSDEVPFQGKTLVSGDHCDFRVHFQPPTVWCYEDVVTVKTEMDCVEIPLKATNPLPVVVLPTFVDMGLCLCGHAVSYSYTLTSKGAGAEFEWVYMVNDLDPDDISVREDPRYDDLENEYYRNNILSIPPFVFYPCQFTTSVDSKQEFVVLFRPPRAGTYYTYVRLKTTTMLHWEIKFKATAVDLRINLQKLQGIDFRPGQSELGIAFGQVTVSHTVSKEVTVQSHTPLPIRFFWRMQSKHLQANKEMDPECTVTERDIPLPNLLVFVADPVSGVFQAQAETPIRFNFTPSDLANYHQVATLYVDTRSPMPLGSHVWRDFREALLVAEYKKANWHAERNWAYRVLWGIDNSAFECSGQTLDQSDLEKISSCIGNIFHVSQVENGGTIFRMIELDLAGSGTQFDVRLAPPLLQFSGILSLGQTRIEEIEMINESPTEVIFEWEVHKTPYGVVENSASVFPVKGKIGGNGSKTIQVTVKANKVGRIELVFHCLVESPFHKGQLPLMLKIEGHVTGPNVIITPCVVDFGLCQRDSTYTMEILITNKSKDAPATFKIFSAPDSQIPTSDPVEPDSQINPRSPNSKVPVGCTIFDSPPEALPLSDPRDSSTLLQEPPPALCWQQSPTTSYPFSQAFPLVSVPAPLWPGLNEPASPSSFCPSHQVVDEPVVRPLDREVSAEFLTKPQERAWISSAFGECLQVFNDGITDPKLPSTTLLHQRDTIDPRTTLPPLKTGPLPPGVLHSAGLIKGIKALSDKAPINHQQFNGPVSRPADVHAPPAIHSSTSPIRASDQSTAPASGMKHSDVSASEVQSMKTAEVPGTSASPASATSALTASGNSAAELQNYKEHPLSPTVLNQRPILVKVNQNLDPVPAKKPFIEQMKDLGAYARDYGPTGPPIHKAGKNYATYEEDLLQTLTFEPSEGSIPKGGDNFVKVQVTLVGRYVGFMRLAIVCEISEGLSPTQYAIARAHIEAPEACLVPCFVDLRTKFINIPIEVSIVIRNMKALPACYNWPPRDRVGCAVEDLDVEVKPPRGEIPPRLEWQLKFKLIPRKLGPLDVVLICNVHKMISPLGLQLKAIIVDVRVSYHVFWPEKEDGHQTRGRIIAHDRIRLKRQQDAFPNPVEEEDPDNWEDPPVPCLDFGRRRELGRAHCLKLVVRNHSPIEAKINLTVGHYHSEPLAALVKDETWVISSLTERLSYLIPTRRDPFQSAMKNKERQHPPLSDLSDAHLKYFCKSGKQMLWRRAEGAMQQALIKEGHSIAFLCYPAYSGILKPWGDWSCEIVCFSNLPGNYIDILTSKVGRLDPVDLPLEVEIVGTPLVARRNWLEPTGLQQPENEGEIVVSWQPTAAGCPTKKKQFWVYNQSPFHMEVNWELKKQRTLEDKFVTMQLIIEQDHLTHTVFTERQHWDEEDSHVHVTTKEHIGIVYDQHVRVVFHDYLHDASDREKLKFIIQPESQLILGHGSYPFELFFYGEEAGLYSAIFAGYSRVYDGKSCERRRSTQFVFDKISDRPDEQYTFRRPEKKHVCEHVVSFHSKKDNKFLHTLTHKTSIIDPPDPEVLALHLDESGKKPKRLSRYHCSEASNSGSEEDDGEPLTKKRGRALSQPKLKARLSSLVQKEAVSDFSNGGQTSRSGAEDEERAYSKVHDIAYQSESEDEEPKYDFDMRRRSTRNRKVSCGRSVSFYLDSCEPNDETDELYDWKYKDWHVKPNVFLDEVMGAKQARNFFNFESIRPLRVSLEAVVLKPRLALSIDDTLHQRLSFRVFGNSLDMRTDTQPLYVTNPYPHVITFFVKGIPEPWEVLNVRKGVLQPVVSGREVQRMSVFQGTSCGKHELEPGKTLQFNLTFRPVVDECRLEPPDVIFDSQIEIEFSHDYKQFIPLHGELLFPELRMMTDTVCLGEVVYASGTQVMDFSLANPCLPDADWRIVTDKDHLETVTLAAQGVPPNWEDDRGLDKIWPVIWSANPERGKVRGRRDMELSDSLAEQYQWNRGIVTISFAPFDVRPYTETVYVEVRLGRGVRLTLEGAGVDETPPTPPPSVVPTAEEPKGQKKKSNKDLKQPETKATSKEAKKIKK